MLLDFTGQCAVVTGGANGIGLAAARALASGGAKVWIFDIERPADPALAYLKVDVTDVVSLSAAFAETGAPDVVVANAGTSSQHDLTDTPREVWDRIIAL